MAVGVGGGVVETTGVLGLAGSVLRNDAWTLTYGYDSH